LPAGIREVNAGVHLNLSEILGSLKRDRKGGGGGEGIEKTKGKTGVVENFLVFFIKFLI